MLWAVLCRFVEYFNEAVQNWQRILGQVDVNMSRWIVVQKQWQALYPIFVLLDDIKEQLPQDTENFGSMFLNPPPPSPSACPIGQGKV